MNFSFQAEKWLNEQATSSGWAKAVGLSNRATTCGLLGVNVSNNQGTIVEVNCETDFVARTSSFVSFVDKVAQITNLIDSIKQENPITKVIFSLVMLFDFNIKGVIFI